MPLPHLLPSNPLRAPLGEVLTLGNQTLMDRTGQQGDAVPAHLVAEVLKVMLPVMQTAPERAGRRTSTSR